MDNKILIIEDEASIRGFIKINLKKQNYSIFESDNGEDGLMIARQQKPNIVLIDIMLPGISGFQVAKILRDEFPEIGIIILTAKGQDTDKIEGFEHGADDYIVKPFNPSELTLRVKALIRRIVKKDNLEDEKIICSNPFKLNDYAKKLFKDDIEIDLTPTEYSLINVFIKNANKAFTRDELLNLVWGLNYVGDPKIVDVNIRRLRSKIEDDCSNPTYIKTIWGIGYRWDEL